MIKTSILQNVKFTCYGDGGGGGADGDSSGGGGAGGKAEVTTDSGALFEGLRCVYGGNGGSY